MSALTSDKKAKNTMKTETNDVNDLQQLRNEHYQAVLSLPKSVLLKS